MTYLRLSLAIPLLVTNVLFSAQENLPQQATMLASRDIVGSLVAEALRNNPGLEAYNKRYLAACESIDSVALPNPKVQITHFVESIETRTGPQEQALMLQQPIPWLSKLSRKRDAAKAQSAALWQAYAIQQFKLVDQTSKQALDIAFLEKSIVITQENIALLKRLESIVENKVKSGGDLGDLIRLQVEMERLIDSVAKKEAERSATTAKLQSLLGHKPTNDIQFSFDWQAPDALTTNAAQWLYAIQERSPQIAMLRSIAASQEAREQLARLASRPDFYIGLNYIWTDDASDASVSNSGKDPWSLIFGVSLPIWYKANKATALQATFEKEAVASQIEELELKLLSEGRAWIAKLKDAQDRIERYNTKLIPLARQAQEITETSYRSGSATILDLIDSDRALLELETEYWQAAAAAWLARWKLTALSGGLWLN